MAIHGEVTDQLAGDGMIIIDGRDVAMVPYSLTLAPAPSRRLVAEGSICGPEPLLRRLKKRGVKLALEDGPVVTIRCEGGQRGTRRVKATKG